MTQLYYELVPELKDDPDFTGWFRKPSNLPFPSPMGTSVDFPFSEEPLYVCGYRHEGNLLYMVLCEKCTGNSRQNLPPVRVEDQLTELRSVLPDDGWEEMNENDEPVEQKE